VYSSDSVGDSSGLTYTWAATTKPAGSTVTFSPNGNYAGRFTTATLTPGSYTFQVTVADSHGLTLTSSVAVVVELSTINGTAGDDTIRLVRNGANLEVYVNNGSATPTYAVPFAAQAQAVTVNGLGGNDSLIVDFTGGATPVPSAGVAMDGGVNTAGGDVLSVTGTSGVDTATVNGTTVTFNASNITYANVESIVINGGASADTLTQSQQPGNNALLSISGGGGDALNVNAGNYTFAAPAAGAGLVATSLGSLSIASGSIVTVGTAAAAHADRTVLVLTTLSIAGATNAWTGRFDLGGNDLVVTGGNLATITNQLKGGLNAAAGYWNGNGIASAAAAGADAAHLTALGALLNSNGTSAIYGAGTPYGPFDNQSPGSTAVLVKYTWFGDTDLKGTLDGGDYSKIDNGFNTALNAAAGWTNGDFNYDGTVDGADYALIDNAYINNGGGGLIATAAVAAAPSPSSRVAPDSRKIAPSAPATFGRIGASSNLFSDARMPKSVDDLLDLALQ
jgi:hypothetical protein